MNTMNIGIDPAPALVPVSNTINILNSIIELHHLYFVQRWSLFMEMEKLNEEVMDDIVRFWTNELNDKFKVKRAQIVLKGIEKQLNPSITDEEAMNIIMAIHP